MNIVKVWNKVKERYGDREIYLELKDDKMIIKEDDKILEIVYIYLCK